MSDIPSYDRNKAAMREKNSTNLNTSGKDGVVVCSPSQAPDVNRPTGHVDPGTGKKS
jgi:hypothetical protein